jgi:ankyrin repeat protein
VFSRHFTRAGSAVAGRANQYSGLFAAAARGDPAHIRGALAKGETPDPRDGYGRTPLHVAVYGGNHIEAIVLGDGGSRHVDTLKALIDAGANVNLPDRNGQSPLALARGRGYSAMVKLLEQAGAR